MCDDRNINIEKLYKQLICEKYQLFIVEYRRECMLLYHASKEIVEFPEIRKTKYTKDFSWGFYCTNKLVQAIRWANRGGGTPIINSYRYEPDSALSALSCLSFEGSEVIYDGEGKE